MQNQLKSGYVFKLVVVFLVAFAGMCLGTLVALVLFNIAYPGKGVSLAQPAATATLPPTARPTSTPSITPIPTLVPATPSPTAGTPTPATTPTSSPTFTATPAFMLPTPFQVRTRVPVSSTPRMPSGLYVTRIRTDPAVTHQKQDIQFYVTFFNTSGTNQVYHWYMFIYEEGQTTPIGQTSADKEYIIPPGTTEFLSLSPWKIGPGRPCVNYVAKVNGIDAEGGRIVFTLTNGQEAALRFGVCP